MRSAPYPINRRCRRVRGSVVDDSMNREENFLEPVIRYVRWGRAEDVRRALAGEITSAYGDDSSVALS